VCVCDQFQNMLCQHLDIEHGHAARSLSIVPLHSDVAADGDGDADADAGNHRIRNPPNRLQAASYKFAINLPTSVPLTIS